jgi:hypothetical protein
VHQIPEQVPIGGSINDYDLWRQTLVRIAKGPAEAAAVLAEHQKGTLPYWQALYVEGFRHEVGFFVPPDVVNRSREDAAFEIIRTYERVSEQARAMLKGLAPRSRGREWDFTLGTFIQFLVFSVADRQQATREGQGRKPMRDEALPKPTALLEPVTTALAMAVNRARAELDRRDDLDPEARKIAARKLDEYYSLKDDAIRKRIGNCLAGMRDDEEHAPDAIRMQTPH